MVLSWSLAWVWVPFQVWFRIWFNVWYCAARRAVKRLARGAVKGAVIGVGCATVLCCSGSESSNLPSGWGRGLSAAELVTGDTTGDAQGGIDAGTLGALTGTVLYFAVKDVGPALDDAVVTSLEDPKLSTDEKSAIRRLNYGYSALKLGLIAVIGKGACLCMDQSKDEGQKVGLACTAGVVMAPIIASLYKTAFK